MASLTQIRAKALELARGVVRQAMENEGCDLTLVNEASMGTIAAHLVRVDPTFMKLAIIHCKRGATLGG